LPRLLYVEDNEDNLYMLTLFFDVQGGYEILSAATGAEGIASAIASCSSRFGALSSPAKHWRASSCVRQVKGLGKSIFLPIRRSREGSARTVD
jgi:hypothetical protein